MRTTHVTAHTRNQRLNDVTLKRAESSPTRPPSINEIQEDGFFKEAYPVDESQTNSNAGDAEVYEYNGHLYEITTWRENAEEHQPEEQTVTRLT